MKLAVTLNFERLSSKEDSKILARHIHSIFLWLLYGMHGLDCFVCELWILSTRSRKLGGLANGLRGRKKEPTHFIWVKIQVNYFFLFFQLFFPTKFHGFQLYFVSKLLNSHAYEVEDESDDYLNNVLLRSREMDPTISINELRWDFLSPNSEINPKKKKKVFTLCVINISLRTSESLWVRGMLLEDLL